jgi:hypothetical protein
MSDTPEIQPLASDPERRRFLCVLGETLDKLYRVDGLLSRQRAFLGTVSAGENSVSGVDALVDFLDEHREEFLAGSDAIVRFLQGETSNEEERNGILATLHILVARVLQVHELLLLIPREAALPQASFVLRDCFAPKNAANAREEARVLRKTAKWGQPISSRRVRSDKKIFNALRSLKSGVTKRERAYEVLAAFDEMPVPSSEILTAGWLYKLSSFEAELIKAFPGAGQKADLEAYSEYVEKTDRRLLKSLELAAVHAELRNRPDPE